MNQVRFDENEVVRIRADGLLEAVRWSDLELVEIVTTDQGPLVDDVFWLLTGSFGGCAIPSEAEGTDALLERLQQLPGFDNQLVIEAMGSAGNARFVCWRKPKTAAAGESYDGVR